MKTEIPSLIFQKKITFLFETACTYIYITTGRQIIFGTAWLSDTTSKI